MWVQGLFMSWLGQFGKLCHKIDLIAIREWPDGMSHQCQVLSVANYFIWNMIQINVRESWIGYADNDESNDGKGAILACEGECHADMVTYRKYVGSYRVDKE